MKYIEPVGVAGPANAYGHDYVDKNAGAGLAGSFVAADAIEHPMLELVALVAKSGFSPTDGDLQQVLKAIRSGALNYRADAGAANALSITLDPAPAAWTDLVNVPLRVKLANTLTGSATLAVTGLPGTKPIARADGSASAKGDLVAGQIACLVYDGTNVQIENVIAAMLPGSGFQAFTANGSFTAPQDGWYFIEAWAGGGGGGASAAGGGASGGGGGAYTCGYVYLTKGQVVSVTVGGSGLGGIASPSANATAGGTSSFGAFMSATGGAAGIGANGGQATNSVAGGTASGGQTNIPGGVSNGGIVGSSYYGGSGGAAPRGGMGAGFGTSAGNPGNTPGGGGAGSGHSGGNGGNGGPGRVEVRW